MRRIIVDCNNENFTVKEICELKEIIKTKLKDIHATIRKVELKMKNNMKYLK